MPSSVGYATQYLEVAKKAALAVGPMLLEGFRSEMDISLKRDIHDFVTAYDRASEDTIRAIILAAFPDSSIVGEEGGSSSVGDPVWYIDPIDGTSNFARGIAFWCVSIAAVVNGVVVAAVIYDPVHEHLFSAGPTGARLNGDPISARGNVGEEAATVLVHFPMPADIAADMAGSMQRYADVVMTFAAVRNLGSGALGLAHVAAGWSDATFNFGTNSWDVAAASLLLKQAGGSYRAYRSGIEQPETNDFLMPDYFAHVADAKYPLIEKTMLEGSAARA